MYNNVVTCLVIQLWDVTRSQVLSEMREHERRVWSIDFSSADPTMLASGSDDGSVKLWSINQAIPFLHLVDVSFETKRTAVICCMFCVYYAGCVMSCFSHLGCFCRELVLEPSKPRQMYAVFSSLWILLVSLHLVQQIIAYITMIFATLKCRSVLWLDITRLLATSSL